MVVEKTKDWLFEFLKNGWAPVVALMSFVFWFGGMMTSRMETPSEKQSRIDRTVTPLEQRQRLLREQIDSHERLGGHKVMEERVSYLQQRVSELSKELARLEREFTSEFVRKNELDILIKNRKN